MYFLLILSTLLMTANTALTKLFQRTTSSDLRSLGMYNLVNALFACCFFWVSAGFRISVNGRTAVYALLYAAIICINLSAQVFAMTKVTVSLVTLMSVAGGVLVPGIFGILYYGEPLTARLVISAVLIILATLLPFLAQRGQAKKMTLTAVAVCGVLFALSGASVILMQLYSRDNRVSSSNAFFFLTNVLIVGICLSVLWLFVLKKPRFEAGKLKNLCKTFSGWQIANIAAKTVLANVCSVLQVLILRDMEASTYAVLNSSLSMVGAIVVSALCFREKQGFANIAAAVLAIAALVVNP